jgi:hypothetical protein
MIKDFLEGIEQSEKGFDERPWEGCPPISTLIDNLVREYLPEEKKKDLDSLLYGAGENVEMEYTTNVAECENLAWEWKQVKEKFEFIFRMLVR